MGPGSAAREWGGEGRNASVVVERHHDTTAVRIFGGVLAQLRCRIGGGPRRRGPHCASHLASVSWSSAECCVLTVTDESVRQMGKVARPAMLNRNTLVLYCTLIFVNSFIYSVTTVVLQVR